MSLNRLIRDLERAIAAKSDYVKSVVDPVKLIKALKELREMIGNASIKESISSQILYLLSRRNAGRNVMLNTVLYGGPGTGKSKVGVMLAKIFNSLGCLRGRPSMRRLSPPTRSLSQDSLIINESNKDFIAMLAFYAFIILAFLYNKIGLLWTIVLAIVIALVAYYFYNRSSINVFFQGNRDIPESKEVEEQREDPDNLVKIVGRNDMIGKFVGWTDKKTQKLLEENVGKVLFIDEAYDLCHGPTDSFGMEALTVINRFMSERPNEIVFVFAGYKHQLESTIFRAQPGLKRRCLWFHSMEGYNAEELVLIFEQQLGKEGYQLTEKAEVGELFKQEYKTFSNFAGDTGKLTFFVGIERSKDIIAQTASSDNNNITLSQVSRAIEVLKKNNINNDKPENRGERGGVTMQEFMNQIVRDGM